MNSPLLLLLGAGTALGLNFPLGKMAMAMGVNAALWAAMISLGAGLAMAIVAGSAERGQPSDAPVLRYAIVSGFLSYVMPNFLTFSAIPKIGSGLAAIMYALSPVVTALLSILFRVRPPSLLGVIGIAIGLAGARSSLSSIEMEIFPPATRFGCWRRCWFRCFSASATFIAPWPGQKAQGRSGWRP
jgi:drug/metabolite transporter (DMT)-like permease